MNKPKRKAASKTPATVPLKKRRIEKKQLRSKAFKPSPAPPVHNDPEEDTDVEDVIQEEENFEVETIVDERFNEETDRQEYFIKWKGWDSMFNTWEPEENLHCEKLLHDFKNARQILDSLRLAVESSALDYEEVFIRSSQNHVGQDGLLTYAHEFMRLEKKLDELRNMMKEQLAFRFLKKKREEQEKALKEWEETLKRTLTTGLDIVVENAVDLAGPPTDFTYIENNMIGNDVPIASLSEHCCGCECTDCSTSTKCCPHLGGAQLAYNKFGKVRPGTGAIYECNRLCKCPTDCQNRMVQHGSKVKLCIFRTKHKGWGVRALQLIKKDTFVVEYVGEVITSEEVDKRGHDTVEGRTYYFDLDFNNSKDPPFSIDASVYGNLSHFINHSCEPNLKVYPVWVDWIEPDLPRLALFATRDIKKGEELCFDYSGKLYDLAEETKKETAENSKEEKKLVKDKEEEVVPKADKVESQTDPTENGEISSETEPEQGNEKRSGNGETAEKPEDLKDDDEEEEEDRPKFRCYCATKKCRKYVLF